MRGLPIIAVLVATVLAQPVPLPNSYDGFSIGSPTAPIWLEGYLDLLCPDCAQAWPTLRQVMTHYGPDKLLFTAHWFPLPYHTFSFLSAHAAQTIKAVNGTDAAVFSFADAMFGGAQQNFYNAAVASMNLTQIEAAYAAQVASTVPSVPAAAIISGFANADYNMAARIAWKFGCSRSTTGTPNFMVNGLQVAADATWTLTQWQQLIDPLVSRSKPTLPVGRS